MKTFHRLTALAVLAGAALAATPAAAAPVGATVKPQAKATILKALTLTKKSDLDFGTILLSNVTGAVKVTMTQAGALTCGTGLVCSGTSTVGGYNVNGTNKQVVVVTAPDVVMNNTTYTGNSITVKLSAPATVTLPNSGSAGTDFPVGGEFTVDTATVDGVYAGDMNVTVDYQ